MHMNTEKVFFLLFLLVSCTCGSYKRSCRSLLAQLDDPFTRFLEPSRYAALKRGTAGSLTGVGLEVGFDLSAGTDSNLLVS